MAEDAGFSIIARVRGNNGVEEVATKFGVQNGEDHFDPAVKVTGHQVGAANKDEGIPGVGEDVDSAVF